MMKHVALPILLSASLAVSPAGAQHPWPQPLTECGGLALVMQLLFREAGEAGNPSAQEAYQSGLALFFQSLRLVGEATLCQEPYDQVYGAMFAHGDSLRSEYVSALQSGATQSDIDQLIFQSVQQCRQAIGFENMMSANGRIAREGVGCGWLP